MVSRAWRKVKADWDAWCARSPADEDITPFRQMAGDRPDSRAVTEDQVQPTRRGVAHGAGRLVRIEAPFLDRGHAVLPALAVQVQHGKAAGGPRGDAGDRAGGGRHQSRIRFLFVVASLTPFRVIWATIRLFVLAQGRSVLAGEHGNPRIGMFQGKGKVVPRSFLGGHRQKIDTL